MSPATCKAVRSHEETGPPATAVQSPSVQVTIAAQSWSTCSSTDLAEDHPSCSAFSVGHLEMVTKDASTSMHCVVYFVLESVVKVTGLYKLGISSLIQRVRLSQQSACTEMTRLPICSTFLTTSSDRETFESAKAKIWNLIGGSVLRTPGQGMLADLGGSPQKSFPQAVPYCSHTQQNVLLILFHLTSWASVQGSACSATLRRNHSQGHLNGSVG